MIKEDTLEVIETLKGTDDYEYIVNEYLELKEILKQIAGTSEEQEVFAGASEEQEVFEETSVEQEVFEENLIEVQKFNFGFSVLNCVLLVCIIFSIWLSKLEV